MPQDGVTHRNGHTIADDDTDKDETNESDEERRAQDKGLWRDLVAFWLLGMTNNYGYVVMLSAAHDIIEHFGKSQSLQETGYIQGPFYEGRNCSIMSTGVLLLANTLPSMAVKMVVPFLPLYILLRMLIAVVFAGAGLMAVANATTEWHAVAGIVMTSFSCGLGESSLMTYAPLFNKNVISTWSSGTGFAGVAGAFSYAFLLNMGMTARSSLHLMMIVPCIQAISFYLLLRRPRNRIVAVSTSEASTHTDSEEDERLALIGQRPQTIAVATFKEKIAYFPKLLHYIIPLFTVYISEYFINQGMYELIYFPNIWLDRAAQYRWLQFDYQIGVFVSRSSVNLFTINSIWVMSVLQLLNAFYFTAEAVYTITPNIWLIFGLVFYEGLLGGSCYVNTYYRIVREVPEHFRNFAMGVVGIGESLGIVGAALLAIPAHNAICKLPLNF